MDDQLMIIVSQDLFKKVLWFITGLMLYKILPRWYD